MYALPSAIVNGRRVHGALRIDSYLRAIEHVRRGNPDQVGARPS